MANYVELISNKGRRTLTTKNGNTNKQHKFRLLGDDLQPVDLTGKEVKVVIADNESVKVKKSAMVSPTEIGVIIFVIDENDILDDGTYDFEIQVTNADGAVEIFPEDSYLQIRILDNLQNREDNIENRDYLFTLIQKTENTLSEMKTALEDESKAHIREDERIKNENTRISQESTRQSNEAERKSAETSRKSAETSRVNVEKTRVTNEDVRIGAENTRKASEQTRESNEASRVTAESTRNSNESARKNEESKRVTAESTRKTNEDQRKKDETIRNTNEDTRKVSETQRESQENTRKSNEEARKIAENTRVSQEDNREKQEGIRAKSETDRINNENSRVSAETKRESQESTRQSQETARQTDTNTAIARLNTAIDTTRLVYKTPVLTKADLTSTYPSPSIGWIAQVTTGEDAGKFFRWNGSAWEWQSEIALDAVTDIQNKLHRTDRKTQTLIDGVNIVDAPVASPTDIEIQGRTMASLGNSNLEKDKHYAITDEKYKVITDGKTVGGVGKFQKGETHKTTADFKNKQTGVTSDNPNAAYRISRQTMISPAYYSTEFENTQYNMVTARDGKTLSYGNATAVVEYFSGHAFAFDIIRQVEKELGIIPGGTTAEKVEWLKSNVQNLVAKWYGYASGPNGYRVTLSRWNVETNAYPGGTRHEMSGIGTLSYTVSNMNEALDSNGFSYFMAHADPSDGTTPSIIDTDYVSLDIQLNPTAQLNTRPTIVRVENFEGKVSGSTVENPHIFNFAGKRENGELKTPDSYWAEGTGSSYEIIKDNDSRWTTQGYGTKDDTAQHMFSFNLVEAVERTIGKIPRQTFSGKREWVISNVGRVTARWYGRGSGPQGNRANFSMWSTSSVSWPSAKTASHYSGTNQLLTMNEATHLGARVDTNGFVHYLAYTDASDGTTSSVINTQYIEIEIELKPSADFRQPRVPLYEVTKDEYDKIGISYSDAEVKRRYPIVRGVQHLVNPYVVNPGENLYGTETVREFGQDVYGNARIEPDELYFKRVSSNRFGGVIFDVDFAKGQQYTFSLESVEFLGNIAYSLRWFDKKDEAHVEQITNIFPDKKSYTFIPPRDGLKLGIVANIATNDGIIIRKPMLTLGTEPKPFTPYNPSTFHAPVTLSAVGDKRDVLYKDNGRWLLRRIVKSIDLTGSLQWSNYHTNFNGFKVVLLNKNYIGVEHIDMLTTTINTNHKGKFLKNITTGYDAPHGDSFMASSTGGATIRYSVNNSDSGFPEDFTPSNGDWSRYFNGWKYVDGSTWESVTGNGQTSSGPDAISNMPEGYTPYRFVHELLKPEIIDVTDIVEGDIAVSGLTQIEVGSDSIVYKEKLNFVLSGNGYYEANKLSNTGTHLNFSLGSVISIHKGRDIFDKYRVVSAVGYWKDGLGIQISPEDFDENAEYFATYKVKDKYEFTVAPDNIKITYEQNIRSAHDALVTKVVDNTTILSIHEKAIVDLFVRLKSLEVDVSDLRTDLDGLREDFDNLPEPTPTEPTDGGTA